jgi:aminoglycoside phosphotransferase (APT) family kinase protein
MGDLHPRNILVEEGVISGIIDWGDLTSGDCATDLASIWMLFAEPNARQAALAAYGGLSKATINRAKGWAVFFGVMLLETGLNDYPVHALIGQRILERLRDDNDSTVISSRPA